MNEDKEIKSSEGAIRRLPEMVRKHGFNYHLIKRGKRSCIYAQLIGEIIIAYEVFHIKVAKKTKIGNIYMDSRERFPHDESFGLWSWSIITLEKALLKFDELEEQMKND